MKLFHDYTVRPDQKKGYSYRKQGLATLDQEAVTTFRMMLGEHAGEPDWTAGVPVEGLAHIQLRFSVLPSGVALATFGVEHSDSATPEVTMAPATTSALLPGSSPGETSDEDEGEAMGQLAHIWMQTWGSLGVDLPHIPHRRTPCIVTIVLPTAELALQDLPIIADMETCLAAAFFEGLLPD